MGGGLSGWVGGELEGMVGGLLGWFGCELKGMGGELLGWFGGDLRRMGGRLLEWVGVDFRGVGGCLLVWGGAVHKGKVGSLLCGAMGYIQRLGEFLRGNVSDCRDLMGCRGGRFKGMGGEVLCRGCSQHPIVSGEQCVL